ncbi:pimeloyl-ACP methyl ester carboxylesterase [Nocardia tenerifensis]|uniref:Pimeloyl-ACP methyl ester carboxylesterase n=2 Tax=Nocardia tenerifensis TaxID=228006 RepID=A0A318K5R9_9NOCA|nr:pimeloyl-ACP methyl ester carboxylesterase [Nocardia tenerifensis]
MDATSSDVRLHVHEWGAGPPVVLVHGGILGGREAWRAQRPLTSRWTLLAPDRPGHGGTPAAGRQDFEPEARLIADQLLDRPVHLVGLSYGAIVSMYAAAQRLEHVRSLTLVEPPLFGVARGNPVVDAVATATRALIEQVDLPPEDALPRFFEIAGVPAALDDPIPRVLLDGMRRLQGARPPDEAAPPWDRLRTAGFPILVISGGHRKSNEIICDAIADRTGAERAVCAGMAHLVPDTGAPFNALLEHFFDQAGTP